MSPYALSSAFVSSTDPCTVQQVVQYEWWLPFILSRRVRPKTNRTCHRNRGRSCDQRGLGLPSPSKRTSPSCWLLAADMAGSRASPIFSVVSIQTRGVSSSTRPLARSTNPPRAVQGRRLVHSRACCFVFLRLPAAGGCPRVRLWSSWSVLSFSPDFSLPLPLKSDSSVCSRCAVGPRRSLCGHQLPGAIFPIRHSWDGSFRCGMPIRFSHTGRKPADADYRSWRRRATWLSWRRAGR